MMKCNNEYINKLVNKMMNLPRNVTDDEIIKLYNKYLEVVKSDKYTQGEKRYMSRHGEMLAILYDGIEYEKKIEKVLNSNDYIECINNINKIYDNEFHIDIIDERIKNKLKEFVGDILNDIEKLIEKYEIKYNKKPLPFNSRKWSSFEQYKKYLEKELNVNNFENIRILSNSDIEKIRSIKEKSKSNTLIDILNEVRKEFPDFQYTDITDIKNKLILDTVGANGNYRNNNPNLTCPKCNGKYIVTYLYGDVFYRLCNGSKEQKKREKEKFSTYGLYDKVSPYGPEKGSKSYLCLHCGNEW